MKEQIKKIWGNDKIIFVIILVIGILFRVIFFDTLPGGINVDEASVGYEAWSLANYGVDRNLKEYPINLIAWGSGQSATYAYLCIPFIQILGLTTAAIRMPNLIIGILALPVMYLVVNALFKNKRVALLSMFMLAVMPWHIMISRWGLDCNIFPFFFLLGTYFLLIGSKEKPAYLYLSVAVYAFSMYTYATSYLVLPVFLLLLIPYLLKIKQIKIKQLILLMLLFIVLIIPIILLVTINMLDLKEINIFNITIPKYILEETRVESVIKENGGILQNIIELLRVIFMQKDKNTHNSIPNVGTYYYVGFIFFVIGIVLSIKDVKKNQNIWVLFAWLLPAVWLGIISAININRINIIWFLINIFITYGTYYIFNVKGKIWIWIKTAIVIIYIVSILYFGYLYYIEKYKQTKNEEITDYNYIYNIGFKEAVEYVDSIKKEKESIYIYNETIFLYQPYIYILFNNPVSPYEFNENVEFYPLKKAREFTVVKRYYNYNFYFENEAEEIYNENGIHIMDLDTFNYFKRMNTLPKEVIEEKDFGVFKVFRINKEEEIVWSN